MPVYELRGTTHLNYEIIDDSAFDGPAVFPDFSAALTALRHGCADPDALTFSYLLGEYLDQYGMDMLSSQQPVAEGRLDLVRISGDEEEYLLYSTRLCNLASGEITLQNRLTEEGELTPEERSVM